MFITGTSAIGKEKGGVNISHGGVEARGTYYTKYLARESNSANRNLIANCECGLAWRERGREAAGSTCLGRVLYGTGNRIRL